MKKILLVEDSLEIADVVIAVLKPAEVAHFTHIAQAEESLNDNDYSLILVDVSLPDGNGFLFLNKISTHPKCVDVPKIVLTGRTNIEDKLMGFNSGAVDYITKPFHPLELKARVNVQLARWNKVMDTFRHGFVEFNLDKQVCRVIEDDGTEEELALTPIEFKIFLTLVKSTGKVISRETLAKKVWGEQGLNIDAKGIDTHLSHLRKKLKQRAVAIVSVYGRGFYFDPDKVPKQQTVDSASKNLMLPTPSIQK